MLKETIEKGENPEKALLRGIKEETKLRKFKIIRKLDKKEKWQAKGINYSIIETYLVKTDMNEKIFLKQEIVEHDKYQWVDKKTATEKLTWPKTKNLLKNLNPAILFKE